MITRRDFVQFGALAGAASLFGGDRHATPAPSHRRNNAVAYRGDSEHLRSPEWIASPCCGWRVSRRSVQSRRRNCGCRARAGIGEADISGHFAAPVILRIERRGPHWSFWVASTSAVSNCWRTRRSDDTRPQGKTSRCLRWTQPYAFLASMVACRPRSEHATLTGSSIRPVSRCNCLPKARSTPSWVYD